MLHEELQKLTKLARDAVTQAKRWQADDPSDRAQALVNLLEINLELFEYWQRHFEAQFVADPDRYQIPSASPDRLSLN